MEMPTVLHAEYPGDLKCPHCDQELEWDDNEWANLIDECIGE